MAANMIWEWMAAKNGIVPLPSSKWNITGLTGTRNMNNNIRIRCKTKHSKHCCSFLSWFLSNLSAARINGPKEQVFFASDVVKLDFLKLRYPKKSGDVI